MMAGKDLTDLFISSHLSLRSCLSFIAIVFGGKDNAWCVRRPDLRSVALLLRVTYQLLPL